MMADAYKIIDHIYDAVVVGAGGSGLRATMGIAESGPEDRLHHQGVPDAQPHRRGAGRHRREPRQHGRRITGPGTCTIPSRGRTGSATRTRSNIWCREAPAAVYELEHAGVPFSRTEDGTIYQRPFGGMMQNMGEGPPAQRTCAAADRTGHAMLHALYQQSLKYDADFYIEYFALDLIMENGAVPRRDRAVHGRRLDPPLPQPCGRAGDGRLWPHLFLRDLGAHLHRRRRRHGAARRPAAAGHGVRPVPPDRHLRRRRAHHRGRARRGRLSDQLRGRALHGALCPVAPRISPRATSSSRSMAMEIREGRGVGKDKDHIYLHLDHIDPKVLHERLPGITETGKIFAGVDLTRQPLPVTPTVHYNMGGIPTNYHGEVVTLKDGNPDAVVPGLFAVGEAACVSVHGANRLGSNSLIDLVVFGRATGLRIDEIAQARHAAQRRCPRARRSWRSAGSIISATPRAARRPPRSASRCSDDAEALRGVPRQTSCSPRASSKIDADLSADGRHRHHRSLLIWNTDLVETLELDNLIARRS